MLLKRKQDEWSWSNELKIMINVHREFHLGSWQEFMKMKIPTYFVFRQRYCDVCDELDKQKKKGQR